MREGISIRSARTADVKAIIQHAEPFVHDRILIAKDRVAYYEAVQEFQVAEAADGSIAGFGALHVMWEDLGEIRTLAVVEQWRGKGIGHALLDSLIDRARDLGLKRLFCLTFEVDFFKAHGFTEMEDIPVDPKVYKELLLSPDEGVAEFLDLARVKPNTLGNTRLILHL